MADEKILSDLTEREIEAFEIYLSTKGQRFALSLDEFIRTSILQGATVDQIRTTLLDDLENNGRIFGEFKRSVKATANGNLTRIRNITQVAELGDIKYRWVAILVNTCQDCLSRHGNIKSWDEWQQVGLPATGQTVCLQNCKCALIPADTTDLEPIIRTKKK